MDEVQIICLHFADLRCVKVVYGHAGKYLHCSINMIKLDSGFLQEAERATTSWNSFQSTADMQ